MNTREANLFLSRLRLLDPRFGFDVPADPQRAAEHAVAAAETWAELLAEVSLVDALAAAVEHYRVSATRLMPVDVLSRCAVVDSGEVRARAEWLAAHGLSEAEFSALSVAEVEEIVRADLEAVAASSTERHAMGALAEDNADPLLLPTSGVSVAPGAILGVSGA